MPIRSKTENIDVLGAKIGNNQHQQWKEKVEKAEKKLEQWTNRRLSIEGRAVLIRTYSLATIIYLATVFPLPDPISTRINKAIFTFLWKSGTKVMPSPKRSRRTEHTEHSENIPNIPRTYRTFRKHTEHSDSQINSKSERVKERADQQIQSKWVQFARYFLGVPLSSMIRRDWIWMRSSLKPQAGPESMPKHYSIVKEIIQENREQLELWKLQDISAGNIYQLILMKSERPKAKQRWRRISNIKFDFQQTWREIWASVATNAEKETAWKASHRVPPTGSYLAKWGVRTTMRQLGRHVPRSNRMPTCTTNMD